MPPRRRRGRARTSVAGSGDRPATWSSESPRRAWRERGGMPWLIQAELTAAGQPDGRHEAEALLADRPAELHPLVRQLSDRPVNVVAHEVKLVVAAVVARVCGKLRRWEGEDQPPASSIDGREFEDVAKERAILLRVGGEDDCMDSGDHRLCTSVVVCRLDHTIDLKD